MNSSGQSLIELILTIAIAAIILPALLTGLITSRNGKVQQDQRLQAVALMKEAEEAVRIVRETGWNSFAIDGTYHPILSSSNWILSPGSETINGYTRQIVISDVMRNAQGNIVTSGGILDQSTKNISITVTWNAPILTSVNVTSYVSRYLHNAIFTQSLYPDFSPGIFNGTTVATTSGSGIQKDGQVELSQGGYGDWCQPQNNILSALTLPKQGNTLVATQGAAYVGSGDGSNGVAFANLSISDPSFPATPTANIVGTYTAAIKTNALFSDGTYAYLATNGSSSQVIILDITHIPYTKIGWIDVPSGQTANGIYVVNNIAYITSSNKLYTYDISTKSGDHATPLASISMWLDIGNTPLAKQVMVIGSHAYVGTANTLFGLQVFKVSNNGATLQLVGVSNLTWQQASQGLFVNPAGTRAYIAFDNGAGVFPKGFFIVDTSPADPPNWWPLPNFYNTVGSYNTGATDPTGMTVATGNIAIIVGTGGTQQYQVINISNEANPVQCGGLTITQGISGISSLLEKDGDAYAYIISGEASNQFKIIEGGLGGQFLTSGTFESATFDATSSALFNRFLATIAEPPQTSLQFQFAVAPPLSNSCMGASFSYVGPNGSPSAYFVPVSTTSAIFDIPFGNFGSNYQNPNRCFRYKTFFTTSDYTQTPVLYDATINYTP